MIEPNKFFNKNKIKLFNLTSKTIILILPNSEDKINLLTLIFLFNNIDTEYNIKKSQEKFIIKSISI